MALGDYLASLNLDPGTQEKLLATYGPPAPNASSASTPPPDPGGNFGPPTATELQQYGASPTEAAAAQRYNAPGPMPAQSATNPTKADPKWTPEAEAARTATANAPPPDQGRVDENYDAAPGRGSPGHYVPSHWQPGTRSETIQHGIDESKLQPGQKSREVALNYGQWAADDTRKAAEKEATADVAYAAAHQQAIQQHAAEQQRIANERQAYTIREHEKLASLNTAAQQQVDPEAAKGSAGAQLFAAIGVALGQFGASINGGTNAALQIVNANIDRRIKAQEMNIANAHKSLSNEQSLYKDNLEAFGDRDRAALATKMQYLDQAKAVLDEQYAAAKSNRNEAQYHAMSEALANKKAEYQDQFGIRTADQVATQGNEHFVPGQTVGGGGASKDLQNLVTLPNGSTVQAMNEQQANKIVDHARIINNLQVMNNKALKLRQELFKLHPLNPMNNEAIKTIQAQLEDMEIEKTSLLSGKDGEGVQRDSEFARNVAKRGFYTEGTSRFRSGIFSPTDQRAADNNIRAQNSRAEKEMEGFATAGGAHLVKRGRGTDANGNVVPVARYTGQTAANAEQLAPRGSKPMKSTLDIPTADAPLSERTQYDDELGSQGGAAPASSRGTKADRGGKGPTVKRHK